MCITKSRCTCFTSTTRPDDEHHMLCYCSFWCCASRASRDSFCCCCCALCVPPRPSNTVTVVIIIITRTCHFTVWCHAASWANYTHPKVRRARETDPILRSNSLHMQFVSIFFISSVYTPYECNVIILIRFRQEMNSFGGLLELEVRGFSDFSLLLYVACLVQIRSFITMCIVRYMGNDT